MRHLEAAVDDPDAHLRVAGAQLPGGQDADLLQVPLAGEERIVGAEGEPAGQGQVGHDRHDPGLPLQSASQRDAVVALGRPCSVRSDQQQPGRPIQPAHDLGARGTEQPLEVGTRTFTVTGNGRSAGNRAGADPDEQDRLAADPGRDLDSRQGGVAQPVGLLPAAGGRAGYRPRRARAELRRSEQSGLHQTPAVVKGAYRGGQARGLGSGDGGRKHGPRFQRTGGEQQQQGGKLHGRRAYYERRAAGRIVGLQASGFRHQASGFGQGAAGPCTQPA